MKRIEHIIGILALLASAFSTSCIYDYEEEPQTEPTIRVHTLAVDGSRAGAEEGDNTFMVLFWQQTEHLETANDQEAAWKAPYLAGHAPQPVAFYKNSAFDTHYPYPSDNSYLYATGYAPGNVLTSDATHGYRRLAATVENSKKGRYDFLGCDYWNSVFRGSLEDPFAQDKNKLYFRHLAAKLVFYAKRDRETMENKQYVRNVRINSLEMSIDGGQSWTPMYTPSAFEWNIFPTDADFTESYKKTIEAVKGTPGNEGAAGSRPAAGYKAAEAETFAGADNSGFVLQKGSVDRVPIDGMAIDSCYVCNPINDAGEVQTGDPIRLRMNISAELSFDPNFPMNDDSGSTTDDLTFTREWTGMVLKGIYEVKVDAEGKEQTTENPIYEFKAGKEYRVYIHFYRTGVNLTAVELKWNSGGNHYIVIPGGDKPAGGDEPGTEETPAGQETNE